MLTNNHFIIRSAAADLGIRNFELSSETTFLRQLRSNWKVDHFPIPPPTQFTLLAT